MLIDERSLQTIPVILGSILIPTWDVGTCHCRCLQLVSTGLQQGGAEVTCLINPFNPAADEMFGGQGHRLGGQEGQVVAGDAVRQAERAALAGEDHTLYRNAEIELYRLRPLTAPLNMATS